MGNRHQGIFEASDSPIHQYLPYLNGALTSLIALNTLTISSKKGVHDGFWLLCLLPACKFHLVFINVEILIGEIAVVLAVTMYAKRLMRSVDVGELEKLKYPYKGA